MYSSKQIKFFLPFVYFVQTRIDGSRKFISWFIIYVIPTLYISILLSSPSYSLPSSFLCYLIQVTIIYNFYEIGYIENDTETIKRELNPTVRLKKEDITYYEKNKLAIYAIRLLIGLGLLFCLYKIYPDLNTLFIIVAISILLIYKIYNKIRSKANAILHFALVSIRFSSFPLVFLGKDWTLQKEFWIALFIFPIINLLEKLSQKRFNIKSLQYIITTSKNLNKFRMIYYIILNISIAIANLWVPVLPMLILSTYFTLYRTAIFLRDR